MLVDSHLEGLSTDIQLFLKCLYNKSILVLLMDYLLKLPVAYVEFLQQLFKLETKLDANSSFLKVCHIA